MFCDGWKANEEVLYTKASLDDLEKALKKFGYEVVRTSMSISATYGSTWSTNGHISTITVNDKIEYRECHNKETSQGYLCNPVQGRLAKIIKRAEMTPVEIEAEKQKKLADEEAKKTQAAADRKTNIKVFAILFGVIVGIPILVWLSTSLIH